LALFAIEAEGRAKRGDLDNICADQSRFGDIFGGWANCDHLSVAVPAFMQEIQPEHVCKRAAAPDAAASLPQNEGWIASSDCYYQFRVNQFAHPEG
jgi:hypothetical protein